MNREDFIKFIPKPENKDVILYDINLQDLIDVDVLKEYNKLFISFTDKKDKYLTLKSEIAEYQKNIDNMYMYQKSWTEAEYLQNLQNYKKTYHTLYSPIKRTESNIEVLQKKVKVINEKIEIQKIKESKEMKNNQKKIDLDISKSKEQLTNYKTYLKTYKIALTQVKEDLKKNQEEFDLLVIMQNKLKDGECKCELCGRTIKNTSENSQFYHRLVANIEKNKNSLEQIIKQKEKIQTNIEYYQNEVNNIKSFLNNNLNFKKENDNFYQKHSVEVLKLEGLRNEAVNNIAKLQNKLKTYPEVNTSQYLELKSKIEKCELSLLNLSKIKEMKMQINDVIEQFNLLKEELKVIIETLKHYLTFLKIYFKIIEQKANEYCGENYKFSFFKIEDYEFIPFFNIKYKNINYSELDSKTRNEVDKFLIEKFSIYI